jgi:aspartate/methionine/tyrosine aminotransferase
MILKKMKMEDWFIKTASCQYNFSESGVPDFTLNEFFKKIKTNKSILNNIFLGNNDTYGSLDLRKEISRLYSTVRPENLITTNGTSEALYIFFNLFLNKKSKILLLYPAFPLLYLIPQALGAKVHFLDVLQFQDKKELSKRLILEIKGIRPDLLIINIPHNPAGFTFNKKEIAEIGQVSKKYKVNILFDEHYRFLPINFSEKILPSGYDIVSKFYKNVFAVGSVIKCVGIVGIRVGWLIANKITLNKIRDYKDYTTHCVPLINETITGLAIRNIAKITPEFIARIKNNWLLLKNSQLVKQNKIILNYQLEGGCVCFPKINSFNSLKLAKILATKYNTSIMPGEVFGQKGYIRINLAQATKDFQNLLKNINSIIKNEKNKSIFN